MPATDRILNLASRAGIDIARVARADSAIERWEVLSADGTKKIIFGLYSPQRGSAWDHAWAAYRAAERAAMADYLAVWRPAGASYCAAEEAAMAAYDASGRGDGAAYAAAEAAAMADYRAVAIPAWDAYRSAERAAVATYQEAERRPATAAREDAPPLAYVAGEYVRSADGGWALTRVLAWGESPIDVVEGAARALDAPATAGTLTLHLEAVSWTLTGEALVGIVRRPGAEDARYSVGVYPACPGDAFDRLADVIEEALGLRVGDRTHPGSASDGYSGAVYELA